MIDWQAVPQQFLSLVLQLAHWMKSRWQSSLAQLVWLSQGASHWWHFERISSVIFSPRRSSKTKFLPLNFISRPSAWHWCL